MSELVHKNTLLSELIHKRRLQGPAATARKRRVPNPQPSNVNCLQGRLAVIQRIAPPSHIAVAPLLRGCRVTVTALSSGIQSHKTVT
eukprot:1196245-Prorocentrum_minimum.AAC.2